MIQPSLFTSEDFSKTVDNAKKIVNVASIPQRSPFRYPGGKTWLIPHLRKWLLSIPAQPKDFIEPFVGGGIASLTVAFEDLASHVTMIELDEYVASVWLAIFNSGINLAERIRKFNLTKEEVAVVLSNKDATGEDLAFQTILRNRINHGGILAPGSGVIKHGENGKGIGSRWYPETLARRILDITTIKHKIDFIYGDGLEYIRQQAANKNAVFFIDPPYTAAGKKAGSRLYLYNEVDHEGLFTLCETLAGDFLMTYDNAVGVQEMADRHGLSTHAIAMKNTHHAEMTELLIGKDLSWVY